MSTENCGSGWFSKPGPNTLVAMATKYLSFYNSKDVRSTINFLNEFNGEGGMKSDNLLFAIYSLLILFS